MYVYVGRAVDECGAQNFHDDFINVALTYMLLRMNACMHACVT